MVDIAVEEVAVFLAGPLGAGELLYLTQFLKGLELLV
jgi:hypothetical protein